MVVVDVAVIVVVVVHSVDHKEVVIIILTLIIILALIMILKEASTARWESCKNVLPIFSCTVYFWMRCIKIDQLFFLIRYE